MAVSPDGRVAAFVTETYPLAIYTLDLRDGTMTKVAEPGEITYATGCCVIGWLPQTPETVALMQMEPEEATAQVLPSPPAQGVIAFDTDRVPYDFASDIYLINADGTGLRQVTRSPPDTSSSDPQWSVDGGRIYFNQYDAEGAYDGLRVVDVDGRNTRALDLRPGSAISPDGRVAAYARYEYEEETGIWLSDTTGGSPRALTSAPEGLEHIHPQWSPDGSSIVFAGGAKNEMDLFLVDLDGSGPRRITQLGGSELQPAWSPDGAWIAFRSLVNGVSDVFVVAADGTRLRRVTRLGAHSPAWSPDGTALAVAAPVKSDELTNKGALYVVRVSDGSLYEVATNDNGFGGLAWQPAG